MDNLSFIVTAAIVGLVIVCMFGLALSRLWRRATPQSAIVRTGGGKPLVTMDGGCFQIPVVHEVTRVSMTTMRLDIERSGDRSLITRDRLRADANVAFFTRVSRTAEGILAAASSLGARTDDENSVRQLVESKFDDVIRAVAMSMTLAELLDKRDSFRSKVLEAVSADLEKNGLELESVSITTLNQTDLKFFKADNVIDAEGLTLITQQTEQRKRERNDITRGTEVAIAQRNLEASQQRLIISQTEEEARLKQEEQVANMTAEQNARVAALQAQRDREAKEAQITAQRAVQQAEIQRTRDLEIAEQDRRIALAQKSEEQIAADAKAKEAQILAERTIRQAEIQRQRDLEIAEQDRRIAIAQKSEAQSAADAKANLARAEAVRAEQAVVTESEVAIANRAKQIAVVAAQQEAEVAATSVRVAAQAERAAAEDRAEAKLTEAKASADAAELDARGIKARAIAEAEGKLAVNEAENKLSPEIIDLRTKLATIGILPQLLREQMKPLEKMSEFKAIHLGGLQGIGGGSAAGGVGAGANGTFAGQLMDALMQYRIQNPIIDEALRSVGLLGEDGKLNVPVGLGAAPALTAPAATRRESVKA